MKELCDSLENTESRENSMTYSRFFLNAISIKKY